MLRVADTVGFGVRVGDSVLVSVGETVFVAVTTLTGELEEGEHETKRIRRNERVIMIRKRFSLAAQRLALLALGRAAERRPSGKD